MRINVRSLVLTLAITAAVAFTSQTASAASTTTTVHVPFSFDYHGKTLPAGDYAVRRGFNNAVITFTSEDGKGSYAMLVARSEEQDKNGRVTVRFDEQDGGYVLRDIQYEELQTARLDKKTSEVHAMHIVHGR